LITHPEKVLFPADRITKGELASYYEAIAPLMVPHISGRPITMERYHRGIGEPGFFQKDVSKGFPNWLARVEVPKKSGTVHHPLVSDARSLVWLANQNCITPHVWISRVPDLYQPDLCVFDLDPAEDRPDDLREAAIAGRNFLQDLV
jgi:bifunctional non-homologous end joining protein LigD